MATSIRYFKCDSCESGFTYIKISSKGDSASLKAGNCISCNQDYGLSSTRKLEEANARCFSIKLSYGKLGYDYTYCAFDRDLSESNLQKAISEHVFNYEWNRAIPPSNPRRATVEVKECDPETGRAIPNGLQFKLKC